MNFFHKFKSSFLYGKALKSFEKKNYKFAASLLEQIINIKHPDGLRKEIIQFYLAISYLKIGENKKALDNLSNAYDLFRIRIKELNDVDDIYYFKILSEEYIKLLENKNNRDFARKVQVDRDELLGCQ